MTVRRPGRPREEPFPVPARDDRSRRGVRLGDPHRSGLGRTPCPILEPILFEIHGSNLPTSLTYIILSTRGSSPWRPAADMGTTWRERHSVLDFQGRGRRTPRDVAVLFQRWTLPPVSRFEWAGC
ncbi:hypothetical protein RHMOL_Rhmol04G0181400 [Rhododendron molle]|uniref:Uncharacterized protein n=1 Tax=Rhododendron molle TaxID=49168 RepID=A0ACC0P1M2_RHOML|nr:hypothetical protein RHMOL_Rhmol04G0181400 [Rhododendron molle]